MFDLYLGLGCFVSGGIACHFLESKIRNAVKLRIEALHVKVDAIAAAVKK